LHYIVNTANVPATPLTFSATSPTFPALDSSTQPVAPRIVDYHLQQPTMAQWNLTVDHQLPWGLGLTVSYIGSKGWHQIQTIEGNPTVPAGFTNGIPYYGCYTTAQTTFVLPGANGACPTSNSSVGPKTNTSFYQALYSTAGGDSYYHSLQAQVVKRVTHGLQFQLNYTYAKALDDGVKSILDPESTASDQTPYGATGLDKGPSFVDIRQNLRANVIYHAPSFQSDKLWAAPFHGWWFGSIISAQTGYPITPTLGGPGANDRALQNNINETDRPDLDPSFNASTAVTGDPTKWFQPTMFDLPIAGHLGNAGRGILRGPNLRNVDLSINKDTRLKWLGEQGAVQFRAELFNILNHANFGLPAGGIWNGPVSPATVASTPVGQIGTAAIPALKNVAVINTTTNRSRQVQLALKIVF
jgi:hypothetical protein